MTSRRGHRVGGGRAEGSNVAKYDDSLAQCLPPFLLGGTLAALAACHRRRAPKAERLLADGERNGHCSTCRSAASSSNVCPSSRACALILLHKNRELTMAMPDDALGATGPGAKNRTWALRRRRRGKLGMSIGRFATAALICAGAALMMSGAADAKASRTSRASKASAPPALDAQAVNAAELSAPSGKGRA